MILCVNYRCLEVLVDRLHDLQMSQVRPAANLQAELQFLNIKQQQLQSAAVALYSTDILESCIDLLRLSKKKVNKRVSQNVKLPL